MVTRLFLQTLTFPRTAWGQRRSAQMACSSAIPLFELDSYAPPLVMMAPVDGDTLDIQVEARYRNALFGEAGGEGIMRIDRYAFYARAQKAYAIVVTGETAKYGNILLKKGVTPYQ